MYHNFFIHSSVHGHLDCTHVLAVVNNAAMNIEYWHQFQYNFLYHPHHALLATWTKTVSFYYLPPYLSIIIVPRVCCLLLVQMVKNWPAMWFWLGLIPESKRSRGEGNGYPFQYSCLENSMDREAWWSTVHGVAKSLTWLSEYTFTFQSVLVKLIKWIYLHDKS